MEKTLVRYSASRFAVGSSRSTAGAFLGEEHGKKTLSGVRLPKARIRGRHNEPRYPRAFIACIAAFLSFSESLPHADTGCLPNSASVFTVTGGSGRVCDIIATVCARREAESDPAGTPSKVMLPEKRLYTPAIQRRSEVLPLPFFPYQYGDFSDSRRQTRIGQYLFFAAVQRYSVTYYHGVRSFSQQKPEEKRRAQCRHQDPRRQFRGHKKRPCRKV